MAVFGQVTNRKNALGAWGLAKKRKMEEKEMMERKKKEMVKMEKMMAEMRSPKAAQ